MSRRAGFTLVELLLAAAIFAVLAVGLYAAFSAGILAHLRGEKGSEIYRNARLALNKIAADFQRALYTSDLGLGGNAAEIYFFLPPEEQDSREPARPVRVTYSVRKKQGEAALYRSQTGWSAKLWEKKEDQGETREITGGLTDASFAYFREAKDETADSILVPPPGSTEKVFEWVDAWKSRDGFPLGIRATLLYGEEKFERFIPSPLRFHQAKEEPGATPLSAEEVRR